MDQKLPPWWKIVRHGVFRFYWMPGCSLGVYRVWWSWETMLTLNFGLFSLEWTLPD